MKHDIVIAGVGGQGLRTIAATLGHAALTHGINIKQSEVHGMAQRGGAVVAHLRMSSDTVYSDLIAPGTADVILAVEPMEALRQLPYLRKDGALLANNAPVRNIPEYPDVEEIHRRIREFPRGVLIDGGELAKQAGSARAMNMVMLGALSAFLELPPDLLQDTIRNGFASKGEAVVETNLKAFAAGRRAAG